jgi:hypothetical protein
VTGVVVLACVLEAAVSGGREALWKRSGRGWILRRGIGGGPEVLVLLEPVADGALHADVVTGVPGLDPLVSWDLVALFEEELPELALGEVRALATAGPDLDVGTGAQTALDLGHGYDGEAHFWPSSRRGA